ncbi:MAG: hypothetical protein JO022_18145, partial [Acidobacteriaceae bacterium]|nr:hypothetical protein [Acidobacteriaceae bacterium]
MSKVFAVVIFLSAFLLFLVQPLIARIILPWFGGTSAVWTTCLVFFQITLLLGYLYAYGLAGRSPVRRQAVVHMLVLASSLLALPILPGEWWKHTGTSQPALRILGLLAGTVGLPYFTLSSTGPLLQAWYSRLHAGRIPYRLYALSNAGSLLALLSYPVVVEPMLRASSQSIVWSCGYGLFVLCAGAISFAMFRSATDHAPLIDDGPRPTVREHFLWIALAACPSALLLAVTNHLTQNIAPIPLLWVVPLAIYLFTLI